MAHAPDDAAEALLREARVTCCLEHPNVVPIHAIGQDELGRPLIVMKLIEGRSWAELLHEQHCQGPGVVMANLDRHIDILIDVAKAAHFAHTRGFIHRDLKPDNVMVGTLGEIYLVDWGIAVSIAEAPESDDITHAREVNEVTGSPAYMAPEMAIGDGTHFDRRTDVYLLGATLHQILTGVPPHFAPTTGAMLAKAYASAPPHFEADVPETLADICATALRRNPEDRFQTAAAFATALSRFLEHRNSTLLADEAEAKLEQLRQTVDLGGGDGDHRALYNLFNEVRFGFLNALRIWSNNQKATRLLQEAIVMMIEWELSHGSAGAAEALIAELPQHMPRLAYRVSKKRDAETSTIMELDELRGELDTTGADRPRAMLAFVMAVTWPALFGMLWYVDTSTNYAIGHLELAAVAGLFSMGAVATAIGARETFLAKARFGLQTQLVQMVVHVGFAALWLVTRSLDVPLPAAFSLAFFYGGVLWLVAAISVDQRMAANAVTMLGGLIAMYVAPDYAFVWMGAAGGLGSAIMGILRLTSKSASDALPMSARWSKREAEQLLAHTRRG